MVSLRDRTGGNYGKQYKPNSERQMLHVLSYVQSTLQTKE
jgi:hypothetical protein